MPGELVDVDFESSGEMPANIEAMDAAPDDEDMSGRTEPETVAGSPVRLSAAAP